MVAVQFALRVLLGLIVGCSASRGLRARELAVPGTLNNKATAKEPDSFAQLGRALRRAKSREVDDDDGQDNQDDEAQEDEVQEVRQDVRRGPPMDATSLMLQSSNALLASAKAAAEGGAPESFAQLSMASKRVKRRGADGDDGQDGEEDEAQEDEAQEDEVQEVRQDVQRGPPMDATSLMLQSSNALLASARAAAEGGPPESFAQLGRSSKRVKRRDADDDDVQDGQEDEEDEVQEVRQDVQRGPPMDATSLMLQSSNALLASAKAAAEGAPESLAQLSRASRRVKRREADDDDGQDGEEEEAQEDEVQEVRQDVQRGPPMDATSLMLQSSNALLASARAAAEGTPASFVQLGRSSAKRRKDDDDDGQDEGQDGEEGEAQEDEVQEVRQDVQRGPPMDATSLMLQSSNALLASARAAAEGTPESFAQLKRASRMVRRRGADEDDDGVDGEEGEAQEDEVQEVRQDVQRGPPMDATSMMLQSSNALLASAKAAAEGS